MKKILPAPLPLSEPSSFASQEPFKLGTFEHDGDEILGIVLRDRLVVDLARANASLERRRPLWVPLPMPETMAELIGRYEYGMKERVHGIVDAVLPMIDAGRTPGYVHELDALYTFAPVEPGLILAAALNYWEHAEEMTTGFAADMSDASALDDAPVSMEFLWERDPSDRRQNPYLFIKPSRIVIASGEPLLMKPQREQMDWECEFAVVIGKPASHVPLESAWDHVFGYTIMNDVGDREGRGDNRYGSDWLVWKSSDTFAPLGPFIVPKEFVADPHDLDIRFELSGRGDAGREHRAHAAQDRRAHPLRLQQHHPPSRRRHRDRHALRRRHGANAPRLHEARPDRGVHRRGDRHAAQPGPALVRRDEDAPMSPFPVVDLDTASPE